jgi:hypothetical protein
MRITSFRGKSSAGVSPAKFGPRVDDQKNQVRALVSAVFGTAIDDYMGITGRACAGSPIQARKWLFSDKEGPFSMLWCCEVLGLEPAVIRARILSGDVGSFVGESPGRQLKKKPVARKV